MMLRTLEDEQLLKDAYENKIQDYRNKILKIVEDCPYLTEDNKEDLRRKINNDWIEGLDIKIYTLRYMKDHCDLAEHIIDWEMKHITSELEKMCLTLRDYHFRPTYYKNYLPSKIAEFNNVDIIITDPCYLIRDDDWHHKLDCDLNDDFDLSPLGIKNYCCKGTLYGDWSCTLFNMANKESIGNFCADAGLVGVFNLQEMLIYNKYQIEQFLKESPWCYTIIKGFTGTAQIATKIVNPVADKMLSQNSYERIVMLKGFINGESIEYIGCQTGL